MRAALVTLVRGLPVVLAGVLFTVLVLGVPAFQRGAYWLSLSREHFAMAALALALAPIILTGGIDLSVGSMTVLASLVIEWCYRDLGWPLGLALAAGVVAGGLAGLGNGVLVSVGVLPLVATLATRELYRGLAWMLTTEEEGARRLPRFLLGLWNRPQVGLPIALWGLIVLAVISYLVVHHTRLGRMIFAVGDNERAARFAGVPVRRLWLGLYAWAGVVAGLCGVGLVMKYPAAKADAERSLELLAIACVVMGGVRVTGGAGHIGGVVVGIVTVGTLLAGLRQVASEWRDTACGVVLIAMALASEAGARWLAGRPFGAGRNREAVHETVVRGAGGGGPGGDGLRPGAG
jgi:ribose/xylose/arabinose/galactoside ABC-type transport system permease subunit